MDVWNTPERRKNVSYLVGLKLSVSDVKELWRNYGLTTITRNLVAARLEDVSNVNRTKEELQEISDNLLEEYDVTLNLPLFSKE